MSMELFRKVRELLGVTKYRMAQDLGISGSHYEHFESVGKRITIAQLVKLYEVSGLSLTKFWELVEQEAKEAKRTTKR